MYGDVDAVRRELAAGVARASAPPATCSPRPQPQKTPLAFSLEPSSPLWPQDVDCVDFDPTVDPIGPATPLCYAASFGNLEAAAFLIKNRAMVRLSDSSFGQTALHLACHHLHADMVR